MAVAVFPPVVSSPSCPVAPCASSSTILSRRRVMSLSLFQRSLNLNSYEASVFCCTFASLNVLLHQGVTGEDDQWVYSARYSGEYTTHDVYEAQIACPNYAQDHCELLPFENPSTVCHIFGTIVHGGYALVEIDLSKITYNDEDITWSLGAVTGLSWPKATQSATGIGRVTTSTSIARVHLMIPTYVLVTAA